MCAQLTRDLFAIAKFLLFPMGTPLGQSRKMLYDYEWKENSMLTNRLAACTHLSSTVSQLFEPQVQTKSLAIADKLRDAVL